MDNFIYSIPTTAFFGKGQISILGDTIKSYGGSKVLLAYGGGSIKKTGIHQTIIGQFAKTGLPCAELSGIKPNPRVESVEEGISIYLGTIAEKAVERRNLGILTSIGKNEALQIMRDAF